MTASADSPRRPVTGTLFGILNILFGVYGLLSSVASSIWFALIANGALEQPGIQNTMVPDGPMQAMNYISLVLHGLLSIVLIVAGVGLLRYRNWGRSLSNAYAALTILLLLATMIAVVVLTGSDALEALDNLSDQQDAAMIATTIGGVVGSCLGLIYPVVLLICINRSNFRQSLT